MTSWETMLGIALMVGSAVLMLVHWVRRAQRESAWLADALVTATGNDVVWGWLQNHAACGELPEPMFVVIDLGRDSLDEIAAKLQKVKGEL